MTYIKIDRNFIELDTLSHLLRLPRSFIEEVVDKGYVSAEEPTLLNDDLLRVIQRIRLATFLNGTQLDEKLQKRLVESISTVEEFRSSLAELYESKVINKEQLTSLSSWGSSEQF